MSDVFPCPYCRAPLRASLRMRGQEVQCPECLQRLTAPYAGGWEDDHSGHLMPFAAPGEAGGHSAGVAQGLGIASLVLGVLGLVLGLPTWVVGFRASFCVCCVWISFIPWPLSIVGIILGAVALVMVGTQHPSRHDHNQRRRGWFLPISGTVTSAVGTLIPVVLLLLGVSLFSGQVNQANNQARRAQQQMRQQQQRMARRQQQLANKIRKANEVKWVDAHRSAPSLQGVQVRILEVNRTEAAHGLDEHLEVRLELDNQNPLRPTTYRGWGLPGSRARLTDDMGKNLALLHPPQRVFGQQRVVILQPGQKTNDVLFFQPPRPGVQYLRLQLPGHHLGEKSKSLRYQIPATMLKGPNPPLP